MSDIVTSPRQNTPDVGAMPDRDVSKRSPGPYVRKIFSEDGPSNIPGQHLIYVNADVNIHEFGCPARTSASFISACCLPLSPINVYCFALNACMSDSSPALLSFSCSLFTLQRWEVAEIELTYSGAHTRLPILYRHWRECIQELLDRPMISQSISWRAAAQVDGDGKRLYGEYFSGM